MYEYKITIAIPDEEIVERTAKTCRELSELIHISPPTIYNIIAGKGGEKYKYMKIEKLPIIKDDIVNKNKNTNSPELMAKKMDIIAKKSAAKTKQMLL